VSTRAASSLSGRRRRVACRKGSANSERIHHGHVCAPLKAVSNVRSHFRTSVLPVKEGDTRPKLKDHFGRRSGAPRTPLRPRTRGGGKPLSSRTGWERGLWRASARWTAARRLRRRGGRRGSSTNAIVARGALAQRDHRRGPRLRLARWSELELDPNGMLRAQRDARQISQLSDLSRSTGSRCSRSRCWSANGTSRGYWSRAVNVRLTPFVTRGLRSWREELVAQGFHRVVLKNWNSALRSRPHTDDGSSWRRSAARDN